MYACLPAANIMDKQSRVAAHRHTPCSREELKRLQELVPRLRELKITKIICSDLDGQSAEALSRRLNVPVEEWEALRRWNWGKFHGQDVAAADAVRDRIADRTAPVKGGDSRASFEKRSGAAAERLRKLGGSYLLIADEEVLEKLIGTGGAIRYHVYEVIIGKPYEVAALEPSPA
jgi:broad specificity phosphatase PhoE